MNGLTRFFLVLLRLAIGWHFLFEGIEKVESVKRGPTESSRPFTSEGYLREGTGVVGEFLRGQVGDLDEAAILTVVPLRAGQDPAQTPPGQRLPPALAKDWDAYYGQFLAHYQLDDAQQTLAKAKLDQAKDQAVRWLESGTKDVDVTIPPNTSVKLRKTTPQRIQEYEQALRLVREDETKKLAAFEHDVLKQQLRKAKADANKMRSELLADLNQPMRDALQSVLRADQKKQGPVPAPVHSWPEQSKLEWIDWITRWGLVAIGLCLLVGLFTRTACLGGALFLLTLYLTLAPFPWLPEPTRVEGHYYYVNKNLIEMLALLALATTRSGRWLGLDGLVQFLNPWRWRSRRAVLASRGDA
jgi:uncharacterized membrane protein YphA (DoxX/SURF4 family)